MSIKKHFIALLFILPILSLQSYSQLALSTGIGMTPQQLVQNFLLGNGVTVSNVKFNDAQGTITISNQIGSFSTAVNPTNLGFTNGLTIATGGIQVASSNTLSVIINGIPITSDPQLQALKPGKQLKDIARLEFDFIPSSDTVKFRYVFASNEYPTAVCTVYDDVFGFFISGLNPDGGNYVNKNIALIPGTNFPVSINTVNGGVSNGSASPCFLNYTQYFHSFMPNITYHGGTVPLIAWAKVVPCSTYHIKIAICDVSNNIYDSGVFLEANSFSSPQVVVSKTFTNPAISDSVMVRGCNNAVIKFKLPNQLNYNYPIPLIKQGTAVNGFDYSAIPDTIFIPANSDSVLLTIAPFNNPGFTTPKFIKLLIKTAACYYDTLLINILPNLPLVVTAKGDTTLCDVNSIPVSVSGSGGIQPYLFTWNNGDTNTTRIVTPLNTTLYSVTLKDACNQIAKDSVLVTIYPVFTIHATANPAEICIGESVQLNASGAIAYLWKSNIQDPTLSGKDTMHNPVVKPVLTTIYKVTATDGNGCKAIDSVKVIVYQSLHPSIIANPNPVSIFDPTVHFIDASIGSTFWQWDTGDGFTSNLDNFTHTFTSATAANYLVRLTVSNAYGCIDSTSLLVVVIPDIKIYIPNAFTPDLPSLNNRFKAYGEGMIAFEMLIYNRWGQLIFESHHIDIGWDGTFLNDKSPGGSYIYSIKYKDIKGAEFIRNGTVNLIR